MRPKLQKVNKYKFYDFNSIIATATAGAVGVSVITSISSGGAGALLFLLNNLQMMGFLLYCDFYLPS